VENTDNNQGTPPPKEIRKKIPFIFAALLLLFLIVLLITYISFQTSEKTKPSKITEENNIVPSPSGINKDRVEGQIIVKFKEGISDAVIQERLRLYHATIKGKINGINSTVLEVPKGQEESILKEISNDPIVKYAEPDYIQHVEFVPNDTYFKNQWGLSNTGQTIFSSKGTMHADVNVSTAWDVTKGAGVKVAIIDTGIDLNHPDVASKVVGQKVFVTSVINDKFGHGTHVAGIIAATTNNGSGVAGVCPDCQLIIAKSLDDTGSGPTSIIATGITWAADSGAKVINMSLGGGSKSQAQTDAVTYAVNKGVVVVAAAGNDSSSTPSYPGGLPNVVSVASTDNMDKKSSFSNFGSWVKVTAPGTNIYSTLPTSAFGLQQKKTLSLNYDYLSGTSMAAPIVSGVVALVWASQYGTSSDAVIQRLYATADKIAGTGQYWQYGRVNAARAVGVAATPSVAPSPSTIVPTFVCLSGKPCTSVSPSQPIPSEIMPSQPAGGGQPSPTAYNPPPQNPSPSPCPTTNSVSSELQQHAFRRGGSNGLLNWLIQLLLRLINLLLQLLGGGGLPTQPPPIPQPTTPPVQPTTPPQNPCPPGGQPTTPHQPTNPPQPTTPGGQPTTPPGGVPTTAPPTGNCTQTISPGTSISTAESGMAPGGVLCVKGGTYAGTTTISKSGTAGGIITVRNADSTPPVITNLIVNASYVTIAGFEITGGGDPLVRIETASRYITLQGSKIHDGKGNGMRNYGSYITVEGNDFTKFQVEDAIRLWGDHHTYRNNYIHDIQNPGHNDIWQSYQTDTKVPVTNLLIEGNRIERNTGGNAHIFMLESNGSNNWVVRNNSFDTIGSHGFILGKPGETGVQNVQILNNTFKNVGGDAIECHGSTTGNIEGNTFQNVGRTILRADNSKCTGQTGLLKPLKTFALLFLQFLL